MNENVTEELKTIFVINRSIISYETYSPKVIHIPKAKMSWFGLNPLPYDAVNLCSKYKEPILTKAKLKNYFKYISWTLVLNKFPSHFCFI